MDLSRCRIPLRDQMVACLLILRQNLPQMVVADLLGVSQPTISRIWRRITVLLKAALLFLPGGLTEAIQQGHLILIDGTHAPYREPPSQRATATTTPGTAISSASMSRSPPPTAVTSSLSLTRCRIPTRLEGHQPVRLARPPRLLRRHLDRRHRHHPDQEATQPVPHQTRQKLQHCHRPNPRQRRTLHRTTENLENPVTRLPRTPQRTPRNHPPRHQPENPQNIHPQSTP